MVFQVSSNTNHSMNAAHTENLILRCASRFCIKKKKSRKINLLEQTIPVVQGEGNQHEAKMQAAATLTKMHGLAVV